MNTVLTAERIDEVIRHNEFVTEATKIGLASISTFDSFIDRAKQVLLSVIRFPGIVISELGRFIGNTLKGLVEFVRAVPARVAAEFRGGFLASMIKRGPKTLMTFIRTVLKEDPATVQTFFNNFAGPELYAAVLNAKQAETAEAAAAKSTVERTAEKVAAVVDEAIREVGAAASHAADVATETAQAAVHAVKSGMTIQRNADLDKARAEREAAERRRQEAQHVGAGMAGEAAGDLHGTLGSV